MEKARVEGEEDGEDGGGEAGDGDEVSDGEDEGEEGLLEPLEEARGLDEGDFLGSVVLRVGEFCEAIRAAGEATGDNLLLPSLSGDSVASPKSLPTSIEW